MEQILDFLNGKYEKLLKLLQERMEKASEDMDFETAIRYRELIRSVKVISQKQKATDSSSQGDRDVIAMASQGPDAVVQVFFVREGRLIGRDHFHLSVAEGDSPAAVSYTHLNSHLISAGTLFIMEYHVPFGAEWKKNGGIA